MSRPEKINKHGTGKREESGKFLLSQQIYHNHGYAGLRL
jgi:hypothetical protein